MGKKIIEIKNLEDISPCPFCGNKKLELNVFYHSSRAFGYPYTSIIRCNCGGGMSVPTFYNDEEKAIKDVKQKWNWRYKNE